MQWTRLAGRLSLSRAEFRTKSDPRLAQMVHFSAVCVGVDPDSSFKKMLYFKDIFTRCACVRFIKRVCVREYSCPIDQIHCLKSILDCQHPKERGMDLRNTNRTRCNSSGFLLYLSHLPVVFPRHLRFSACCY